MAYLEENVAAADLHLSGEERAELDALFDTEAVVGERYAPGAFRDLIDRE